MRRRKHVARWVQVVLMGLALLVALVVVVAMLAGLGALVVTALRSSRPPTVSASEPVYRTPVGLGTE